MTVAATTATTATAATNSALSKTAVDFDMFLKLLTTQMQNQDPLKPMDSTEYTAQLAQFSQVEQTVKQTGTLADILAQLTTQNMAQASGFIGRDATFDSAVAGLSAATPAHWGYSAPTGTTALTATITDAAGVKVATVDLDPAKTDLQWDGKLSDGRTAPAGGYTLSIAGTSASGDKVPVAITSIGRVTEVLGSGSTVTLGVNGVQQALGKLHRLASAD